MKTNFSRKTTNTYIYVKKPCNKEQESRQAGAYDESE